MARGKKSSGEPLHNPRGGGLNGEVKKVAFLELIAEGMPTGMANRAAGIGKNTAARWRKEDPDFLEKYEAAVAAGAVEITREIKRRALKGVRKPVVQQGRVVYWVDPETDNLAPLILQEFSDTLLMFLAKARDPETFDDRIRALAWERRKAKDDAKRGEGGTVPAEAVVDMLEALARKRSLEVEDAPASK